MSGILIPPDDLADFVASLFKARGMSDEDAATFSASLVWANLRGIDSHGVARVPWYFDLMKKGELDPKARPALRIDAPAFFIIDAHRSAGPVAMTMAMNIAVERSRTTGTCIGIVSGTTHTGAIGNYAAAAAKRGRIALIFGAGVQNMAYHGAAVPSLSTCPIAIAAPSAAEPLVADFATSVVAMGRIQKVQATGESIPSGWALAADGTPTTDGTRAAIPLPVGGHKGSDLALMLEVLTGVLAGNATLAPMLSGGRPRKHTQSAFLMAIDVTAFRALDSFKQDVSELVAAIKSLPRRAGFDELYLPGEWGRRHVPARSKGIPVAPELWATLTEIAGGFALPVPQPVAAHTT